MIKRRLGKTEHMSSILTFVSAALWQVAQPKAEMVVSGRGAGGYGYSEALRTGS